MNALSSRTRTILKWTAIIGAPLVVGYSIGASDQPEPEVRTRTETVEVTVPPETVEVEVEVPVVPDACRTALDRADEIFGHVGQLAFALADWFSAPWGSAAETDAESRIISHSETVSGLLPGYETARDECRAAI